ANASERWTVGDLPRLRSPRWAGYQRAMAIARRVVAAAASGAHAPVGSAARPLWLKTTLTPPISLALAAIANTTSNPIDAFAHTDRDFLRIVDGSSNGTTAELIPNGVHRLADRRARHARTMLSAHSVLRRDVARHTRKQVELLTCPLLHKIERGDTEQTNRFAYGGEMPKRQ